MLTFLFGKLKKENRSMPINDLSVDKYCITYGFFVANSGSFRSTSVNYDANCDLGCKWLLTRNVFYSDS